MLKNSPTSKDLKTVLQKLEPYVAGHGGRIKLIAWSAATGVVKVKLEGNCRNCFLAPITLQYGLAKALKQKYPQIKKVEAI